MVKSCNNCNYENSDDAEFCGSCGKASLNQISSREPPKLVCAKCKNVSTDRWPNEFCANCGFSLSSKNYQYIPKKNPLPYRLSSVRLY